MTPHQISIVQASFGRLLPIPGRVGARFYARLFYLAPEARDMFPDDMAEQQQKLVATLATVVARSIASTPFCPTCGRSVRATATMA